MQYHQYEQYEISITNAEYADDGSLNLSLQFGPHEPPPLDEILTKGYVKMSVYEKDEFVEDGTLALYGRGRW